MSKNVFTFLVASFITLYAVSQRIDSAKLDSLFNTLEANDRYMGSLALSHEGRTIYAKAIGYRDIKNSLKPTTSTKYRVGSITKMFTSVLVFKAIEGGKLKLDQTLDAYFPEIENSNQITIANLLNHRSGIHSFTSRPDYQEWDSEPKTRAELLEIIRDGGSVFEPNSKAEYSNSNYVLLTFILEDVLKKPYSKLISEKITLPLGLKDTYVGGSINLDHNEAHSYTYVKDWEKKDETHMSIPLGAGALVSTPTDLNVFIHALFTGVLLSKESLNKMKTISDGYGMGIFPVPFHNKSGYGHNGGIDGFTSVLGYMPEDKVSVALTSNGNRYANNDIIIAVLSAYYGKPFEIPTFKTIKVQSKDLDKYLGIYASKQLPLKITITKDGDTLFGQATGQPSFPMEAVEKDIFEFAKAGVRLEFVPDEKTMVLKQAGGVYHYKME
ncbi:serine hydrolase [Ulvibacterium sp.]|uniref:serine hydrolase domain-containing protein n=1 Tax=Ulvibacterium sp. TaxID=2665914 RepID=UPI0026307817|nr:serine hydrolase domain-containing protein [Ulvibacterium sp.]